MRNVIAPITLLALSIASYVGDFRPRAAAAPDLAHPALFKFNGLSSKLSADWRVTANDSRQDTDGRGVSIEVNNIAFEVLNLEVVVQVQCANVAHFFRGAAQYLYRNQVDDKHTQYTKQDFAPVMLSDKSHRPAT